MTMTRRDFENLASDLRNYALPNMSHNDYQLLLQQVAATCKEANTRFNKERFYTAAMKGTEWK